MSSITEGSLTFDFPAGWEAVKFDTWSFYRNQFTNFCGQAKAVDILALDTTKCLWLIEIKDYRRGPRAAMKGELAMEIAHKVRDTMVALAAARLNAQDQEKAFSRRALRCSSLRIVLHLEQPRTHSKLYPRPFDPANVEQKLKQLLKPLDAHPGVHELGQLRGVEWTVMSHATPDSSDP